MLRNFSCTNTDFSVFSRDQHIRAIKIMPRVSKRRNQSRSASAIKKRCYRKQKMWEMQSDEFNEQAKACKNPHGRCHQFEENKLLLLALAAALRRKIVALKSKTIKIDEINWTSIEKEVASDFYVGAEYIAEIRKTFLDDGDIAVFGEDATRGGASEAYSHEKQQKVTPPMCLDIARFIDDLHSKGKRQLTGLFAI